MRAISKAAPIIAAIIVIVIAGGAAYFYLQQPAQLTATSSPTNSATTSKTTTTSATTQTTLTINPAQIRSVFDDHLNKISARDIPVLLNDYEPNAVVTWTGNTAGLGGNYSGTGNIRLLYAAALSTAQKITLTPTNYTQSVVAPDRVLVSTTLNMSGSSQILGPFNGTIVAKIVFTYDNGAWKIINEAWDYKVFNVSQSGGATTFPEWQKVGPPVPQRRGPDWLHDFVWDYGGPLTAMIIYAYIIAIAVFMAVKRSWKQSR